MLPVLPQYLHGPKYLSNFKIAEFQNPMQRCAPDFRRSAGTVGAQDTPWPDPARIWSESVEYRSHLHAAFGLCAGVIITPLLSVLPGRYYPSTQYRPGRSTDLVLFYYIYRFDHYLRPYLTTTVVGRNSQQTVFRTAAIDPKMMF